MGEGDWILLPYDDLKKVIENRLRWRAYSRAWEVQRLGKVLDPDIAGVTSG